MNAPLMPKATAVWLVDNTALTFDQIAEFCGLHALEVQAIADEEVAIGMQGLDPIANGQLTREEISRCEGDTSLRLEMAANDIPIPEARSKGPRYTPLSKRQDKPDAVAWLLRHYPELSDAQIGRLIGTTKPTINSIRDRTHWNSPNLRPRSPVEIGLCTMDELESNLQTARKRAQRKADRERKAAEKAARERGEELPPLEPAASEAPAEEPAAETPSWTTVSAPKPEEPKGKPEWPTLPGQQESAAEEEEEAETPSWPTLPGENSDDEQKGSQ
jgi:hypothetical protein